MLRPVYKRARQFMLYREKVNFLYTFGYGLFRVYFLALGDRFVRRGLISHREDVFYLQFNELRDMAEGRQNDHDWEGKIAERKREFEEYKNVVLPSAVFGAELPPLESQTSNRLKGIPTSKGFYRGPARVVRGTEDFSKLKEGDVLVIPYSDVGWTPLFSRAGAVVAESGGFLSHSSIIAREYGVPAIVSVPGACGVKDGSIVTVDGYRGEVVVHESSKDRVGVSRSPSSMVA
jgi:pyruvate,water dikinase